MKTPLPFSLQPRFVFLDLEASGLHDGSYPIEVAIASDDLSVESWLMRPAVGWTKELWASSAEAIHGITRDSLADAPTVEIVARTLNERLRDKRAYVGAIEDTDWLTMLHQAGGIPATYSLVHVIDACEDHFRLDPTAGFAMRRYRNMSRHRWNEIMGAVDALFPHRHRAGPDAQRMAARFRAEIDEDFAATVLREIRSH